MIILFLSLISPNIWRNEKWVNTFATIEVIFADLPIILFSGFALVSIK